MIKFTAVARVHSVSGIINISERFSKRELVLDDSWEKDGQFHENYVVIEFTGERMALLNQFTPGQRVTVEACINGRDYNGRIFNTIRGLSVAQYVPMQQPAQQPMQQPAPQQYPPQAAYPQPAYPQPGAYPQQPAYPGTPAPGYDPNVAPY